MASKDGEHASSVDAENARRVRRTRDHHPPAVGTEGGLLDPVSPQNGQRASALEIEHLGSLVPAHDQNTAPIGAETPPCDKTMPAQYPKEASAACIEDPR